MSLEQPPHLDTPAENPVPPKPKKRRRTKNFKVVLETANHFSVDTVQRSSPAAAVAEVARTNIKSIPLQTPQKIWVKSSTKIYPFFIERAYISPKFRRFNVRPAGDPLPTNQPSEAVPAALRAQ